MKRLGSDKELGITEELSDSWDEPDGRDCAVSLPIIARRFIDIEFLRKVLLSEPEVQPLSSQMVPKVLIADG